MVMRLIFALAVLISMAADASTVTGVISKAATTCIPASTSACAWLKLEPNASIATVTITGTWTATLQFEVSTDSYDLDSTSKTWVSVDANPLPSGVAVTSTAANGSWSINVPGATYVRVRASAYTSGTASVSLNSSTASVSISTIPYCTSDGTGGFNCTGGATFGGSVTLDDLTATTIGGVVTSTISGSQLANAMLSSLAGMGRGLNSTVAVTRKDANTLLAYRSLGGKYWQEIQFSDGGGTGPYNWNGTRIVPMLSWMTATNAGCTYSGATWQTYNSQANNTYVAGTIKLGITDATDYVECTFTGAGEVYGVFYARPATGYVKCEIDGDTNNCNALPVGGTGNYRYIDTYKASDTYKYTVKLASGLTQGSHTVKLSTTADKNPSSTLTRWYFNAVALSGDSFGLPYQSDTHPPTWTTGTVYAAYDQVQYLGRYYSTAAGGTAGATPPTHTSGSVSDGGVTWLYMAGSSFDLGSHTLQASGSQLEYAYQIKPDAASTTEDVGGLVHGNETLTAATYYLDGDSISDLSIGSWAVGKTFSINESITAAHSTAGTVSLAVLSYTINSDGVTVTHDQAWQQAANVGWFYTAMWPSLRWTIDGYRWTLDYMWTPQGGKKTISDYYGQTNPVVGKTKDFIMLGWGDVLMPAGTYNTPSSEAGPMTAVMALYVDPWSVDEYIEAGNYYAGMAVNSSGITPPGYSSEVVKMYFERATASSPTHVTAGDVWHSSALYLLKLVPGSTFSPI